MDRPATELLLNPIRQFMLRTFSIVLHRPDLGFMQKEYRYNDIDYFVKDAIQSFTFRWLCICVTSLYGHSKHQIQKSRIYCAKLVPLAWRVPNQPAYVGPNRGLQNAPMAAWSVF